MKISVFTDYVSLAGKEVMRAFIESLDGVEVVQNDLSADVAVIWSVLWNGRMAGNEVVWRKFRSENKPIIVLEVGALKRNETWKV